MLTPFDWLRRCQSGAELLALLDLLEKAQHDPDADWQLGEDLAPPGGALQGPCLHCGIFPRPSHKEYCTTCQGIVEESKQYTKIIRRISVIWGYLDQLPRLDGVQVMGRYVLDDRRFLLMLPRQALKPWLQQFALGESMQGLLQIFPTMGSGGHIGMGDVLCRAIHHEANLPMNQLWIRFFSAPHQLVNPRQRNEEGILSFGLGEFIRLMDMAEVFRTVLRYDQQKTLHDLLKLDQQEEQAFQWGRFARQLDQRAHDMLSGWNIRQWPENKIKLLYELTDYVLPTKFD